MAVNGQKSVARRILTANMQGQNSGLMTNQFSVENNDAGFTVVQSKQNKGGSIHSHDISRADRSSPSCNCRHSIVIMDGKSGSGGFRFKFLMILRYQVMILESHQPLNYLKVVISK